MEFIGSTLTGINSMYGGKRKYDSYNSTSGSVGSYGQKLLKGGWMPSTGLKRRFRKGVRGTFKRGLSVQKAYNTFKTKENRYVDNWAITPVSTTAVIIPLNVLNTGVLWYEREGRLTHNKALDLKLDIYVTGANVAAHGESTLRVMIVWDKLPQGSLPAITDILLDTGLTGTTQTNILSNVNMNKRDRYEIISQEFIGLPAIGVAGVISNLQQTNLYTGRNVHRYLKINRDTAFNVGTAGTIADINFGALYLIVWSDSGAFATPAYSVEHTARLSYYE